ncbi:LysM peptidoglycan-binding domain-containing protein [Pelotomaculum propionicicum]|uniref:LysM peptidoglycan-binding domain-containing protein n=1 Tax=Pelotomaculum propionicicum TaxID=258475 RepID=UPI003B80A741
MVQTNTCPPGSSAYTIMAGDSLYLISEKLNVPFTLLYAANKGVDPANLQIGQVLCIPPNPCTGNTYPLVIEKGFTLSQIGIWYGLTVEEIIAANPGVEPENLQVGQVLCLPVKKR